MSPFPVIPGAPGPSHPNVAVPHFTFPFQMGLGGHAAVLEQDSDDEIVNCVDLIVSVPKGALIDEPELGIIDPTFSTRPQATLIAAQIREWEPRAQITAVEAPQGEDLTLANIIVRVATGTP